MSLPVIEHDPYGERIRLERCRVGRPLVLVSDDVAAAELAAPEWTLLGGLGKRDGFAVEHGTGESIICYRGYRVGGIDRTEGHWFVSEGLGTYVVDRFLRRLGFQKRSRAFGSNAHAWYELDHIEVEKYGHALDQLAKAIDRQEPGRDARV